MAAGETGGGGGCEWRLVSRGGGCEWRLVKSGRGDVSGRW